MALTWSALQFKTDQPVIEKLTSWLCCCGLCYSCKPPKIILNDVCGRIQRSELVALMGPSGAGKSTLLNCFSAGKTHTGCEGRLVISGIQGPVKASYITQDVKEHLLMSLTVKESLWYASQMKNPPSTSGASHARIIQRLISELGLNGKENTVVHRCSGGELKGIAIGLELTAEEKPHFLFLDEPTSGLDSSKGFQVVLLLKNVATLHNMAVITIIHQPSSPLFKIFSKVFVISGSGDFVYKGSPTDLVPKMQQAGHNGGIDNPADSIIAIAGSIHRREVGQEEQKATNSSQENANFVGNNEPDRQETCFDQEGEVDIEGDGKYLHICRTMIASAKLENSTGYSPLQSDISKQGLCVNGTKFLSGAGFYSTLILLLRTVRTSLWNQKRFILIRCALHMVVASVLVALYNRNIGIETGCVFFDPALDPKNCTCMVTRAEIGHETVVMQNIKFQFFSLLFLMFASLMPTVLTFPAEIRIFLNEYRNGWYSCGSYYVSKTIAELFLQVFVPFGYTYFLYWYTNQPDFEFWYNGIFGWMPYRYGMFLLVTLLCGLVAQGLGFLIGILCVRSFNISIILSSSVLLFLFLFSGFFVKRATMGIFTAWMTSLSFIRYGFESLLILLYGFDRCTAPYESSVLIIYELNNGDLINNIYALLGHLLIIRLAAFVVLICMAEPSSFLRINQDSFKYITGRCETINKNVKPVWKMFKTCFLFLFRCCFYLFLLQTVIGIVFAIWTAVYRWA